MTNDKWAPPYLNLAGGPRDADPPPMHQSQHREWGPAPSELKNGWDWGAVIGRVAAPSRSGEDPTSSVHHPSKIQFIGMIHESSGCCECPLYEVCTKYGVCIEYSLESGTLKYGVCTFRPEMVGLYAG